MTQQRVDLTWQYGHRRLRRWRTGTNGGWSEETVTVGQFADQSWFVSNSKDPGGAVVYPDHRGAALAVGIQLCDGRPWSRIPAAFNSWHEPIEPGWLRSGQSWYRTDEPEHTTAERPGAAGVLDTAERHRPPT